MKIISTYENKWNNSLYLLAHVASLSSFSFLVKSYDSLLGWLQEDVKIVKLGQENFNIYRTLEFFWKL